jgi:hypothetical protein
MKDRRSEYPYPEPKTWEEHKANSEWAEQRKQGKWVVVGLVVVGVWLLLALITELALPY